MCVDCKTVQDRRKSLEDGSVGSVYLVNIRKLNKAVCEGKRTIANDA